MAVGQIVKSLCLWSPKWKKHIKKSTILGIRDVKWYPKWVIIGDQTPHPSLAPYGYDRLACHGDAASSQGTKEEGEERLVLLEQAATNVA